MLKKNIVIVIIGAGLMMALASCGRSVYIHHEEFIDGAQYGGDDERNIIDSDGYENDFDESGISDSNERNVPVDFYNEYEYISTEEEGDTPLFDTTKEVNIFFAGNSLLKTPRTFDYFEELVARYELPANTERELWDGMDVKWQVSIADSEYSVAGEEYADADIIIIQEYGGRYETTYEDICELLDRHCKEDVIVYYYTTEWDGYYKYIKEMNDDERIHILDFGKVQDKLNQIELKEAYEKEYMISKMKNDMESQLDELDEDIRSNYIDGYDTYVSMYEYIHELNDYHPNELNGFLAAAYIYTQLYKTDFNDYTYDELSDWLKKFLPGENDEKKEAYYNELIQVINEGATGQ